MELRLGSPIQFTPDLILTQDYTKTGDKLDRLFERGGKGQWYVGDPEILPSWDTPIDFNNPIVADQTAVLYGTRVWDKAVIKDGGLEEIRRDILVEQLSSFLHAEQMGLVIIPQLVGITRELDEKLVIAQQVNDEARHVEFFRRMVARTGNIVGIHPDLYTLGEMTATVSQVHSKCIAMQVVIEGLALAMFRSIVKALELSRSFGAGDVILETGLKYVLQDEGRHVALGPQIIQRYLKELKEAEHREAEDFLLEALRHMQTRFVPYFTCLKYGFDPKEMMSEFDHNLSVTAYRKSMLIGVLPQAHILGLVPERLKDVYTQEFGADWDKIVKRSEEFFNKEM
jgi:hypothetical protein